MAARLFLEVLLADRREKEAGSSAALPEVSHRAAAAALPEVSHRAQALGPSAAAMVHPTRVRARAAPLRTSKPRFESHRTVTIADLPKNDRIGQI